MEAPVEDMMVTESDMGVEADLGGLLPLDAGTSGGEQKVTSDEGCDAQPGAPSPLAVLFMLLAFIAVRRERA
jgi:uncharacterized protein (TIGR03382 family)